jgi:CHAT domain-containing protein
VLALADAVPIAAMPPLPFARTEAAAAVRLLGGALYAGPDASERLLLTLDMHPFGVLHFGVHAMAEDDRPERAALRLSAADANEDGLVHPGQIASLDLQGKLAVLAACRTSSGPVLGGEGAMSLSRSFLRAGARAVLGALWPLRDDESAEIFERFYRSLGEGAAVRRALSDAIMPLVRAGEPAASWAGLMIVGDGSFALTKFQRSARDAGP